jgi:AcrR family transcriptional regulator
LSTKKDHIVKAAKELFWKYGIKRVTIEEICQLANVSKMTYYKYFLNKTDLVKHIFEMVTIEGMEKYRSVMDSNIPFNEKVLKSIELKIEQTNNISKEFYNELMNSDDKEIKQMITGKISENIAMILNDYKLAQKKGEIRKDIKPEFILYFINHMMEMGQDERLSMIYATPQEMILELTNFFFYGILPRQDKTK